MDWIAEGRRRAKARIKSLVDSAPALTLPVRDTAESAPGWRFLGETYSCAPDVAYPWDPAVVRAIREFCPDAQPILVRTVWKSSRLDGEPKTMVLVRHGLARAIRDPIAPVHSFQCRMPSTGSVGARLSTPNYIEVVWYDKEVRPWGYDLPGAYLPFDWEFYQSLRAAYVDSLLPAELSEKLISPYVARKARREKFRAEEQRYTDRDLERYARKKLQAASELEQRDFALAEPEPIHRPSIVVP
jgi:hypothetical protein